MKLKKEIKIGISVSLVAALLGAIFFMAIKPRLDLRDLARETCDEIDGAMIIVVAGVVTKAVNKAERLGFEKHELREEMINQCPGVMRALDEWARSN